MRLEGDGVEPRVSAHEKGAAKMVRVKGEFKKLKVHKVGLGMTTRKWSFRTLSAPASENSELVIRSRHAQVVTSQFV